MIIIYKGTKPYLPITACQIHLRKIIVRHPQKFTNSPINQLMVWGTDNAANVVCCLVPGRYGDLYTRAINSMAQVFGIDLRIIDIDKLVDRHLNWLEKVIIKYCPNSPLFTWVYGHPFTQFVGDIVKKAIQSKDGRLPR